MRKSIFQAIVFAGRIAFGMAVISQPAAAAMRPEYTIKNDKFGVNAYVYGKRTVLEFIEPPFSLVVKDKQGFTVSYERIGERFYRLARQLDKFSATVNGDVVEFDVYKQEQFVVLPPAPAQVETQAVQPQPSLQAATMTAPATAPAAQAPLASGSAVAVSGQPGGAPVKSPAASAAPVGVTPATPAVAATAVEAKPAAESKIAEKPSSAPNPAAQEPVVTVEPQAVKPPAQVWEVEAADLSVFAAVKRWTRLTQTQERKWQLSWEIPVDYPVTITGTYSGNFEDAVGDLLEGYSKSDYRPKVCVYSNSVVRIVRFLGTGTECD